MVYPRQHLYVTWGGTAWAGNEIWQCGVRVDRTAVATPEELEALAAALETYFASNSIVTANAQLAWVKTAPITPTGQYPVDEDATLLDLDPVISGNSGQATAPQVALKITLRTDRRRGRGHVGGFFSPCPPVSLNSAGKAGALASTAQAAAVALLEEFQAALGAQVVIGSNLGQGVLQPVTGVTVGDTLDTQRRRRNALAEVYLPVVPLPPS